MKYHLALILTLSLSTGATAQNYDEFTATVKSLYDTATREQTWAKLISDHHVPLVVEDSVAFFYRGNATSVSWQGDFNRWGYNKEYNEKVKRIPESDLWVLKASFPKDARLDYKIVLNGSEWILDPYNDAHQWSGVGGGSPNSELRMPLWKEDPLTAAHVEGAAHGRLEKDLLLHSKSLNYQMTYSVYTPPGYSINAKYPIIYVMDGYEYMHERLGNMITILDNLIYLKRITPVVAVFIDHREPINRSNNRRMQELALNEKYFAFLTDELIPKIEKKYHVMGDASHRAILGTSLGGLSAAYFSFTKPEIFGLAGIQSPAFYIRPDIYKICDNPDKSPVKTFMSTGVIYDAPPESIIKMKTLLDRNTCTYQIKEVNQGHSWGNFRDLIDDLLIYFFPVE
jgi:enterochelin esterase-like enzyme